MARLDGAQGTEVCERNINFLSVLKSVLIAILMTVILLFLFAFVVTYSDMPKGSEEVIASVVSVLSIVAAGAINARRARRNGWLNGLIAGVVYMVILYITGFLAFGPSGFDKQTASMLVMGAVAGAVGGIIGINIRSKRKK